jgi:hypothetical protein
MSEVKVKCRGREWRAGGESDMRESENNMYRE